jgi:hypothetical protein
MNEKSDATDTLVLYPYPYEEETDFCVFVAVRLMDFDSFTLLPTWKSSLYSLSQ